MGAVILDRVFEWKIRTARDHNRYFPRGLPHSPVQVLSIDSEAFHALGRIPKHLRIRIEVAPDE